MVVAITVWIARWSEQGKQEQEREVYIVTLTILALGAVVVSIVRAILAFFAMVRVSSGV